MTKCQTYLTTNSFLWSGSGYIYKIFLCFNVCDRGSWCFPSSNTYQMTILVSNLSHSKAKLQVKCLYMLIFLSFPLVMAEVPGPCRHSITREHLLTVKQLMDNQLSSGCSITYTFTERRSLSKCCFVKAALPWILELLTTNFKNACHRLMKRLRVSQRALRSSTKGLLQKHFRKLQRCWPYTGNWLRPATHLLTGDVNRNTQKVLDLPQSRPLSHLHIILQRVTVGTLSEPLTEDQSEIFSSLASSSHQSLEGCFSL
ncbi:uncharacterized protein LOC101168287 isoform X4 [Oryzias latipes]|uniref:uncharacterized protein LOC101168287 isoform X4 n=1 Tax=Oryzias latipes TaxID=8090 RepID=UPI000CE19581|nr:uncharacterized protein LOC101168287 isoform X4 [Oryzias latipes]